MSSQVTLKANGLNFSPNNLSLPKGSLLVADDVVIRRDDTIESRRGIKGYSQGFGSTLDRAKQLIEYKGQILLNYATNLAYDTLVEDATGASIFNNFSGTYNDAVAGLRMKSIEVNKDLYFTTSEGIKTMAAKTAADFTTAPGFIKNAGAVKALDFSATLALTQGQTSGFLDPDSTVAYRVVWGYKNINDNLKLGVPSDRIVVYNYLTDQMALDLNKICIALDSLNQTTSLITNGDYAKSYYVPANSLGSTLLNNVLQLATKLDTNIYMGSSTGPLTTTGAGTIVDVTNNTCTLTFASGNPSLYVSVGDKIELKNYTGAAAVINGFQTVSAVTSTTIKFLITTANFNLTPNTAGDIYSNNYRNIVQTGDAVYSSPLNTLILSIPPTSTQLRIINNNISRILDRLKLEKSGVIPTALQTAYLTNLVMTLKANVNLKITVPTTIDSNYFVQVYRTRKFKADGVQTLGNNGGIPVVADDEMRLIYEAFPTAAQIAAGQILFLDNYPEELIQKNTNLYTNPTTGDGILAANNPPPFCKDINTFKNVTFYANTKTKYQIPILQLLGIANIVSGDKVTISNGLVTQNYTFVSGVKEVTDITCVAASSITAGQYFILYSAQNATKYYFWYEMSTGGTITGTAPAVTDGVTVKVPITSTMTAVQVSARTRDVINDLVYDFVAVDNGPPKIRVTTTGFGKTTVGNPGTTTFTVQEITAGDGEDAATKQVLLSSLASAAQAIDETSRSFVRIINKQAASPVNAYYISGNDTPPGQINLENKNLSDPQFYVTASSAGIGLSFKPEISPDNTNITSISIANPTVITTAAPHNLVNQQQIVISNSNSTPSINGLYTVTVLTPTTFTIPVNVTVAGTAGSWTKASNLQYAVNEVKANRIYYSKLNQPDAVPLLNYLDVGAQDQAILRIFPLRDSLFVFKEDGLYRISGEISPFVQSLFDSSCVLIAPDSVDVSNNEIYAWTLKGIVKVNETGTDRIISRPIDTQILKLGSSSFPNFSSVTWGIGYDSDNTYTVYTNANPNDTVATIGFTYSNLTNTWTNVKRSQTCGIVVDANDTLYMGSGTTNVVQKERKDFSRTDYCDDELTLNVAGGSVVSSNKVLRFPSVKNVSVGDVITQTQKLTPYLFNKALITLDLDPGTQNKDYYATLAAVPGDDMRLKIVALAAKLDGDSGVVFKDYSSRIATKTGAISSNSIANPTLVTTSAAHNLIEGRQITITGTQSPLSSPSILGNQVVSGVGTFGASTTFTIPVNVIGAGGTGLSFSTLPNENSFIDIAACFNELVNRMNADTGLVYNSYTLVTESTVIEGVVTSVNNIANLVTMNIPLQWIVGPVTLYKSIPCAIVFSPETLGDAVSMKQIREATVMLESRAVTSFTASFSSDLIPEFFPITFTGSGNGIFGSSNSQGFGYGFFGGAGGAAPFRTLIPPKIQRCRYILVKVEHSTAREKFILDGVTLTGEVAKSTRAYR